MTKKILIDKTYIDQKYTKLTGEEYMDFMFEKTDLEGILYIPGWYALSEPEHSIRCELRWNCVDCENIKTRFQQLKTDLMALAKYHEAINNTAENAQDVLSPYLFRVWDTYIKPFHQGDFDVDMMFDISDRLDTMNMVQETTKNLANGTDISLYERQFLKEYLDTYVTAQEREKLSAYTENLHHQSKLRLGKNICAYQVIIHARRLYRLYHLRAPGIICQNEERSLAAAMVVHAYGISMEQVDNELRLYLETMDELDDDTLDAMSSPQKVNSRKSMAPLFVYDILKNRSSRESPMRQQEILKQLSHYPYEINLERKALSRILHSLTDSYFGICSNACGVWYEK